MKDRLEKQPDQTQKLESGSGAGPSSQFDLSRQLRGADGRRNPCIPQTRLFKDYISYTYVGPDVPPQPSEETLSTGFHHDAPSQKSPMSALGPLEMIGNDDALLCQAATHYERGKMSDPLTELGRSWQFPRSHDGQRPGLCQQSTARQDPTIEQCSDYPQASAYDTT